MIQPKINKFKKTLAIYLAMMILLETFQPMQIYALTGGPSQPEFESFTPIGTSDMVDLASGDFNYNIPIMDVGGYPINLAYNSGVTMDQEASWVGLGWDLNVGQITRQMRGLPDDFNGDEMTYENNMKPNVTIGSSASLFLAGFGTNEPDGTKTEAKGKPKVDFGMAIKYNNYDGFGAAATGGVSFEIADNLRVGMNMESSASEGVTIAPYASYSLKSSSESMKNYSLGMNTGVSYNSRKGIESTSMSFAPTKQYKNEAWKGQERKDGTATGTIGGSLSQINASYTPTKRLGMVSTNFMFGLNIELEFWGLEPGMKFKGYRTSQGIKDSEKYKIEKAYGFENTYNADKSSILDYNREKDRSFNKNTTSLPLTNNTYDIYNILGQGVSGTFRPYKSQVGYVYDNEINDDSYGGSLGIETGAGGGFHWGYDASVTLGKSYTKLWENSNPALGRFKEKKGKRPDYEKVFFKNIGGTHVDKELDLFNNKLGGYNPIKLGISGGKFSRSTNLNYSKNTGTIANTGSIQRESSRLSRNQSIQKLTKVEAKRFGSKNQPSAFSRDHHTTEIRITKEGGERYIYGRAAYNVTKREVTFDVSDKSNPNGEVNFQTGLVNYNPNVDNSARNKKDGDQYFNRVTTPAYAHSYLLTSVLSSDYQDLKNDGPTDDDLGSYTKFEYENKTADHLYKWRIPFLQNKANYDEGLRSSKKDNKGNYIYGEKELLYIKKIVTKTHIAIFHLSERNDAYGVKDENGGRGDESKMFKLDKISLYSKPEYLAEGDKATPIKEANFEYNYSLCKGIDNSITSEGKLTLSKVYFTYKNSNMGKYTPYVFNYGFNPDYDMKAYDVWGNYKPANDQLGPATTSKLSNPEFPFVDQSNKTNADQYTSAWLLKSIRLPSGGQMQLNYESDDYGSVQNKDVMQMFKIVGSGSKAGLTAANISNGIEKKGIGEYIYVELDKKIDEQLSINDSKIPDIFYDKYLKSVGDASNPLYFRFLLNMVNPNPLPGIDGTDKYDYVTGYLNTAKNQEGKVDCGFLESNGKQYVAIPVDYVEKGDGFNPNSHEVNPITKAGWNFGRHNLHRLVYSMTNEEDTTDLKSIVMELVGWMPTLLDIFKSPNAKLEQTGIASRFITNKSWIRLLQPDAKKLGGGCRVKDIKINDQWDVMTDHADNKVYQQSYGQRYSYQTENGKSSGVATYEPLGCKENPFVKPFYDEKRRELLLGPDDDNYVEEPFGESFFPAPKVTYSRVTVTNLPRDKYNESNEITSSVKKHATGSVITEFYTSKDYPTIVDRTTLSSNYDTSNILASILSLNVKDHITLSQGYSIHTNDMDGKMKNQRVYGEGQKDFISGVDYKYNTISETHSKDQGKLNNTVQTIDSKGAIASKLVGVDYDVINDFRETKTTTTTAGINLNFATIIYGIYVVMIPVPLPSYSKHESQIRMAVTTKVIHTTAILSEKIAYDLGSKVSTKNLAYDAENGDVLLTETVNEYNDKYFNFNFPAYWSYDGMSQAAKNLGLEWDIEKTGNNQYQFTGNHSESDYLIDGDELWLNGLATDGKTKTMMKAWAVHVTNSTFKLIDEKGLLVKQDVINTAKIKVIRSGHRNMQMASMASVTSMTNPLYNYGSNNNITTIKDSIGKNPFMSTTAINRIVNASAVQYNNVWPSQCECNLPKMVFENGNLAFEYEKENNTAEEDDIIKRSYNPYLYNILGNWRANKSYAYLTGRNYTVDPTPRKTGFFNDFFPFYVYDNDKKVWGMTAANYDRWTFASEVTQYNPTGQEVENKDALKRYSSALYGYNNRFPVAVASNTKYTELASDGFEDYDLSNCGNASHFDFQAQLKINDVSVSNKQSHTGTKSLKISPNKKATLKKQVVSCSTATTPAVTAKK
ncbi:hypothetical protein [Flavobacterium pectinovorum]|uniref:PA14 domain-containing protein n=1 Tax=Flavobacterium pectinovorum TaxID=29533 RepID=A0AB36NZD5_9FLAO|nr:hypothetical protein [Flavobacterium pectinovorum]OXB04031.1 hypothetical protein B0A72_14205 [Flavobacterium pectinovorum]WKL46336.1 hypothetical protein Q1W71_15390 [Flavobacterium pectinovorum]SHN09570.1 hypothetical protein SAMN05444387_4068 [Flavobacterium pectinovorum]